jgi:hypothetical protein
VSIAQPYFVDSKEALSLFRKIEPPKGVFLGPNPEWKFREFAKFYQDFSTFEFPKSFE